MMIVRCLLAVASVKLARSFSPGARFESSAQLTTGARFESSAQLKQATRFNTKDKPGGTLMSMSSSAASLDKSWSGLQTLSSRTPVGAALNEEKESRKKGVGAAFVQNKLRMFDSQEAPRLTLYRDHAGWCPYCQKTMLLIEEKEIPINIELVPMRSYGDKPQSFTRKVPSGLLPALGVQTSDGREQIITESQVIMDLLDQWHTVENGYRGMMPKDSDSSGQARFRQLANLERQLFSFWCNLIFRPEGPSFGSGGMISKIMGGGGSPDMSGSMQGFLECMKTVDSELASTKGPWFFDFADHPTMIDFIYVSHVERMLASCAFWKGLDLRSDEYRSKLPSLNAWLDAFEKRECYLAFKSDYYTHVKDIPPQYGPGYDGGFENKRLAMQMNVLGKDGKSWELPLPFDDELQPLYRGPPLPICVLKAAGIQGDNEQVGVEGTSYEKSDPVKMDEACRHMAAWKLAGNGENVAKFAARGGPGGSKNPRKTFGAELADPYASPDEQVIASVEYALQSVCIALLAPSNEHESALAGMRNDLEANITNEKGRDVASALCYLRDRTGVPRDLPLAAARQLRAHLNAAIDVLYK